MTVSETFGAGRAVDADKYLTAAVEAVTFRAAPTLERTQDDPVRQLLALAGVGQAILALGDRLDDRLADVADAVTGVQDQVSELCDAAAPVRRRRWGRGRTAASPAITPADMALVVQALTDAYDWRTRAGDGTGPDAEDERAAHGYLALRERLGSAS